METSSLLDRIIAEEMRFIVTNKEKPKYLLMSVVGQMELIHELGGSEDMLINGLNKYSGMDILVSQDENFPQFILAK